MADASIWDLDAAAPLADTDRFPVQQAAAAGTRAKRATGAQLKTFIGAVLGPASSTDTALAAFDGTTGLLLKNTAIRVNGGNTLDTPGGYLITDGGGNEKIAIGSGRIQAPSDFIFEFFNDIDISSGTADLRLTRPAANKLSVDTTVANNGLGTVILAKLETVSNGNLTIDPHGTGDTILASGDLALSEATGVVGIGGLTSSFSGIWTRSGSTNQLVLGLADRSATSLFWAGSAYITSAVGSGPEVFLGSDGRIGVKSNGKIGFTATANADGTIDSAFGRAAAGVLSADTTAAGNALGAIRLSKEIEVNTAGSGAPNVLLASESNKDFSNEGAVAETYTTLPSCAAGLEFGWFVHSTFGQRVTAAAGDTIQAGTAAASAAAGFIRCATKGAYVRLRGMNATEWMSTVITGTWTVDT